MRILFAPATLALLLCVSATTHAQDWVPFSPMPTPRAFASASVLNGQIYVMGGVNQSGVVLEVVERYDPALDMWFVVEPLDDAVESASATVFNGRILVIGGREDDGRVSDDVQAYNSSSDEWESFAHLEEERAGHAAFSVGEDVYAFGGSNDDDVLLDNAEVYNQSEGDWEDYGSWTLTVPRAAFAAVPYEGGAVIFGGYSTFGPLADVEYYEPDQGGVMLADLPIPRGGLTGALAGGRVYAIGGRDATNSVLDRVDVYDPGADEWNDGPVLPESRVGAVAASVGGTLYVFGGFTDDGTVATTSISLNVSTANEDLPSGRTLVRLASANPFTSDVAVSIHVEEPKTVEARVFDSLGRLQSTLYGGNLAPGNHVLRWDARDEFGRNVPAGVYFVMVRTDEWSETLQITRVR